MMIDDENREKLHGRFNTAQSTQTAYEATSSVSLLFDSTLTSSINTAMSYKSNATSNRNALFGGASSGGSKTKKSSASKPSSAAAGPAPTPTAPSSKGYSYGTQKKAPMKVGLSGAAKDAKLKEAEDYRDKAKKAMQKGLFSSPDPLAASTYYKRAADAYQVCGEARLERLYRINSADCQARVGAWATAAAEYTRAAELVQDADDETPEMKQEIGRKLYLSAADAWRNMNDPGKAAVSTVQAAMALMWGDESSFISKVALTAIEESVEAFVPDPLNFAARYRQTGHSAYIDPNSEETAENPSPEALELAKQHLVDRPYAHETLQEVRDLLVANAEYASALYVAGAITTLLSENGVSTLSLSRAFVAETIITLAMGDPIAAEENFLSRHVQKSSYLTSRECKLAEELFRAVKMRDLEALEEARAVKGTNKSGIGNLPPSLRELIGMIRLSGVARKGEPEMEYDKPKKEKPSKSSKSKEKEIKAVDSTSLEQLASKKTGYEGEDGDGEGEIDPLELQDELDALDFGDDESDLEDDDIDLR